MITIDASIAVKWVLQGEEDQEQAFLLLNRHFEKKEEITVPELLFYEVANTLTTKTSVTSTIASKSIKQLMEYQLKIYHPDSKDIYITTKLAKRYKTSVYDMLYTVVAKKHKTILITADGNFLKKTRFSFVKLISDYK